MFDLRQALALANIGETIIIPPGVYYTWGLITEKSVNLVGVGRPKFVGNGLDRFCKFRGSNSSVEGVDFSGFGGAKGTLEFIPIGGHASRIRVKDCDLTDVKTAVYVGRGGSGVVDNIVLQNLNVSRCYAAGVTITGSYDTIDISGGLYDRCEKNAIYIRPTGDEEFKGSIHVSNVVLKHIRGDARMQGIVAVGEHVTFNDIHASDCSIRIKSKHWSDDCFLYARGHKTNIIVGCTAINASGIGVKGKPDEEGVWGTANITNNTIVTNINPDSVATKWAATGIGTTGKPLTMIGNHLDGCRLAVSSRGGRHIFMGNTMINSPYDYAILDAAWHELQNDWRLRDNNIQYRDRPVRFGQLV